MNYIKIRFYHIGKEYSDKIGSLKIRKKFTKLIHFHHQWTFYWRVYPFIPFIHLFLYKIYYPVYITKIHIITNITLPSFQIIRSHIMFVYKPQILCCNLKTISSQGPTMVFTIIVVFFCFGSTSWKAIVYVLHVGWLTQSLTHGLTLSLNHCLQQIVGRIWEYWDYHSLN